MNDHSQLLLVGAGRLGGALLAGWTRSGSVTAERLMIRDPAPGALAREAEAAGARLNPADLDLGAAGAVVLAVKPQGWRAAADALAPVLAEDAVVISVMAGVRMEALAAAFPGRPVARVMPTTAVEIAQGVAALHAPDDRALATALELFSPIATVVKLDDEALMDAAVGVSGSAPAYLYAFTEALAAAGEQAGLPAESASALARATMESAAALMAASPNVSPAELRAAVTSPRGTTEAALDVLLQPEALPLLLRHAVAAAAARSRALAGDGAAATSAGAGG